MIDKFTNKKQILLVDDDRSVTQMLSLLFETRGYQVTIARSGQEALEKVSPKTDLILLDLILPDQDGFDVCRKFKESKDFRQIPIIILSAKILSEDIVEGLYLGADDYLIKPFEYEELVARMEAVMRRSSTLHQGSVVSQGDEAIVRELRKIIDEELIIPFFQPIFFLKPFSMFGLEALSRPKTQSMLVNPELLFKAAVQFGFYQDLEMLSWRVALKSISQHLNEEKLFLNCNPYLVEGPKFQSIKTLFENSNVPLDHVILEITERSAIIDFDAFFEQLQRFRDHGFKFAVDDVGGGYSSLESIVKTKPEVVKIDRHIVNGLQKDDFKRSVVKFIVSFCKENNIISIAEGIETKQDLKVVMDLGVDAAQGYFLCKPTAQLNLSEMLAEAKIK